jgi:hypothetical protein
LNFRLTLVLLAAFAILGGGVWYSELRVPKQPSTPTGQATVFDLKSEDATRIEVEADGKRAIVERGADNVWRLAEPLAGEADNVQVESAVGRLTRLSATRKLDAAANLADYGLANPTTKVRLTFKDGAAYELLVGAKTPDNSSFYLKRSDAPDVYVVSAFTIADLTKWTTEPPKPRPTPTALPPLPPLPSPSATGG